MADEDGYVYLLVVTYNYEAGKPESERINDHKLTFSFDDGDTIIADGVYDPAVESEGKYVISGGTGKYLKAQGQAIIGSDGVVNMYEFDFC